MSDASPEESARQPFDEIRVRASGLEFRVLSAGEGDELALCLHGFPECAHSWRHQLPLLAGLGYRAWAPDLRGYGQSDRPPSREDYAIEKLLGDVAGWIEASGARSTTLIGHDWGAIIAWYFAMRYPELLTRLVIMNVPHPAAMRTQLSLRQFMKSWYAVFFQLPGVPERLLARLGDQWTARAIRSTMVHPELFDDESARPFVDNARQPGAARAMLDYYRAAFRGGGFRRQEQLGLSQIETPTLMIWGEQDVALTKALAFGTAAFVPDLVQRFLPDASHWVQQDQPELVNTMLAAWLQGAPVPHAAGASADFG
jgi:pimeloyl-ACP methyl ester carboxylesterase